MSVVESFFGGPPSAHSTHSHHSHKSGSRTHSHSHSHKRESSPKGYFVREKSPTRRRGSSPPKGYFVREKSPTRRRGSSPDGIGSIFGFGGGGREERSRGYSESRGMASWLLGGGGSGRHNSGSSAYRRRPRDGYISRLVATIQRLFRRLVRYARENPVKLFMLVIMPLVTGGALHKVLKSMGVQLPRSVENMMGGGRGGYERYGREHGGGGGGVDLGQVMNVAKMFM